MDGGYAWTKTKRFLTIIPCIIFIIAINFVRNIDEITERNKYMVVNVVQTLVLLIAKMPFMHKKRVFGINKTNYD